jgi:hypothetical protein
MNEGLHSNGELLRLKRERTMNYLKMIGLAAVAAAALMSFGGTASATTPTSPSGTTYTGTVHLHFGRTELHGPFTTISCGTWTFHWKWESHGASVTAGGKISSININECNYPVKVLKAGSLEVHGTGGGNGTVTWSGGEITIETSIANCIFTTSNTDIGTLTGGTPAKLDVNSAAIPRTGHSFFCGSGATWTGSGTVLTPGTLLID